MMNKEKNRILKLHQQALLEQKVNNIRGGTNTSSSGQFDGTAFKGEGPLTTSGRQKDIGSLPDEVDITKGSKGVTFNLKKTGGQETTIPQPLGNEIWAGPPQPINNGNVWVTVNGEIIDITGLTGVEVQDLLEDLQLYPGKQVGTFLTGKQIFTHIYTTYGGEIAGEIRNCIESGGGNACLTMIFNLFPPPGTAFLMGPDSSTEDALDNPLSLSCCKKCDNGRYTNKCFPLDGDEDCTFPTLEVCEDETDTKMPSLSNIFS
tara:strand:+ start:8402 stop:9184 length:783 start_codon:yes stop_codon:yes gene_type:complete